MNTVSEPATWTHEDAYGDSPPAGWMQPICDTVETISTDGRPPWVRVIVSGMHNRTFRNGAIIKERMDIGFPRYIPGVGALWHLRFGFDAPLRDWIEEQGEDPNDVIGMPF